MQSLWEVTAMCFENNIEGCPIDISSYFHLNAWQIEVTNVSTFVSCCEKSWNFSPR